MGDQNGNMSSILHPSEEHSHISIGQNVSEGQTPNLQANSTFCRLVFIFIWTQIRVVNWQFTFSRTVETVRLSWIITRK